MRLEEQNQTAVVSEIGPPADSTPIKDQHGGKGPGAGRKRNIAKRLLNGVKPMTAAEALEGIDVRAIVHDLLKNGSRPGQTADCPDDNEIGLHVCSYTKDFVDRITVLNAKQRRAVQLRASRNQLLELVNECRLFVRPLLHV